MGSAELHQSVGVVGGRGVDTWIQADKLSVVMEFLYCKSI